MTPTKQLLVATPLYPPDLGGPATYAAVLARELPREGVPVDVVTFGGVRHVPKVFRHIAYGWNVYKRAKYADVILALDPVSVGLPALVAAKLRGKPFFVKVVGDYAWEQGRQRFGITEDLDTFVHTRKVSFSVSILRAVQTCVASRAQKVLVPSHYLKTVVSAWGIPDAHIEVVYNAVESIAIAEHNSLSELPHPLVLSIGRLVPWKHVDAVIDAVGDVTRKGTAATLVVIGTGPLESSLIEYAKKEKVPVQFLGAQSPEDTQRILAKADVLVLNSSYEGLSHVLIEGIMQGKAIIATRAGGNAEVITDGVNGLLIAPHDTPGLVKALEQILGDTTLSTHLQEGARASQDRFTREAMIQGTRNALRV